jgi:hypothetical protein
VATQWWLSGEAAEVGLADGQLRVRCW